MTFALGEKRRFFFPSGVFEGDDFEKTLNNLLLLLLIPLKRSQDLKQTQPHTLMKFFSYVYTGPTLSSVYISNFDYLNQKKTNKTTIEKFPSKFVLSWTDQF